MSLRAFLNDAELGMIVQKLDSCIESLSEITSVPFG